MGAADLWSRLDDLLGRPTSYRRVGNMFVAANDDELEMLAEQRRGELALGLQSEMLNAEQVRELAPGLSPHFIGGKLCPTDGHASPAQATVAIFHAAEEAGAQIFCHNPVEKVGLEQGRVAYVETPDLRVEAPVVVNAAGPWAPYLSQMVEVYLPIFPSRAYGTSTPPMEYIAGPFTITASWDFSVVQGADGRVRVGGGADRADVSRFTFSKGFNLDHFERLKARAPDIFPALRDVELEHVWAGTRECTPDMMPIVGPVEAPEGFFVCAGFSGHGFALGPYAGQLVAEWIVDGKPSLDLSAFDYRRFNRAEGPLSVVQMNLEQTG
jgi:sarcosine oxidase subunit beta